MKPNVYSRIWGTAGVVLATLTFVMEWAEAWEMQHLIYHMIMACFFLLLSLAARD